MRLSKLSVVNYLAFEKLDCDFDDQLNLIIGWNGAGKTSLLMAMTTALRKAVATLAGEYDIGVVFDPEDTHTKARVIGSSVRFEPCFPTSLAVTCTILGETFNWSFTKHGATDNAGIDLPAGLYSANKHISAATAEIGRGVDRTMPLVVSYGSKRSTQSSEVRLADAVSEQVKRSDGYQRWSDALVNADELQRWVIGATLERLQIMAEQGTQSPQALSDELSVVNQTLGKVPLGLKGLRYDLRLRVLGLEYVSGEFMPFGNLSDGQRSFITLIADIARRTLLINPHLGVDAPQQTPGILFIDELELHLHPQWQRLLLKSLKQLFPSLQIFATTHSPQMVGGLHPNQVLVIGNGRVYRPAATYGQDVNRILEDVMMSDSREDDVAKEIRGIFEDIEDRKFERAKERLTNLKAQAPDLPEYGTAEALIKRVETIGR